MNTYNVKKNIILKNFALAKLPVVNDTQGTLTEKKYDYLTFIRKS